MKTMADTEWMTRLGESELFRVALKGIGAITEFGRAERELVNGMPPERWATLQDPKVKKEIIFFRTPDHLGWIQRTHFLVLPRRMAKTLQLHRVAPAKGSGYGHFELEFLDPLDASQGATAKTILLASVNPNKMNRAALKISQLWTLELQTFDSYDC